MPVVEAVVSEYQAAQGTCGFFEALGREQLRVVGPDAVSFVQGMVTNDVEGLAVGGSCYATMLTPKGAMVGDARIFKGKEEVIFDTGPGRGSAVKAFLEKYLISEEAEVQVADDLAVAGLVGPEAGTRWAKLPSEAIVGDLWAFYGGKEGLVRREHLPSVRAIFEGVSPLSAATLEVLRVERKAPLFGVDMTEVTIPLEANLEHAIHYQKGCYVGQEVIARATYRGQMNKKLMLLSVGEAAPEYRAELKVGERKAGWITSVVKSPKYGQNIALGYVHRDFVAPGTEFLLGAGVAVVL